MTQTTAGSLPKEGVQREGIGGYLVWLGVARLLVSWGVTELGLRALSDDDYARITIAQRFADHARLDPSGTSWLPFPFWVTGGAMKVLDPSLDVARATSAALAVGATWLLFAAGRVWGWGDRRAFVAALAATVLPVVATLGAVSVPELPTAALALFAVVCVSRGTAVVWAGTAMLCATLSRYETWPIAVVVSAFAFARGPGPLGRRVLEGALPLAGPLAWIVHNRIAHGDALSFLRRVSSYRAALGATGASDSLGYARALVVGCPAIAIGLAAIGFAALRGGDRERVRARLRSMLAWAAAAVALFAFLLIGQLVGGAPTHHAERALLLVWLLGVFAIVEIASLRRPPAWVVLLAVAGLAIDWGSSLADRGVDRRSEETIGTQLRSLVPKGERAVVATNDYGYFAVIAAFGRPSDAVIDQTHDPRQSSETSIVADHWNAPELLRSQSARWLVAPSQIVFPMTLRERTRDAHLAIFELEEGR
jgi:hypothetical protein